MRRTRVLTASTSSLSGDNISANSVRKKLKIRKAGRSNKASRCRPQDLCLSYIFFQLAGWSQEPNFSLSSITVSSTLKMLLKKNIRGLGPSLGGPNYPQAPEHDQAFPLSCSKFVSNKDPESRSSTPTRTRRKGAQTSRFGFIKKLGSFCDKKLFRKIIVHNTLHFALAHYLLFVGPFLNPDKR